MIIITPLIANNKEKIKYKIRLLIIYYQICDIKNKTVADIRKTLREHEKNLKARYGIKRIGIFGSFVRGEAGEEIDLDLLVEFEPEADVGLLRFVEAENHLSDLLGVKVDLVERAALRPRIGKHILEEVVYA